jgi:hypothetical protein
MALSQRNTILNDIILLDVVNFSGSAVTRTVNLLFLQLL